MHEVRLSPSEWATFGSDEGLGFDRASRWVLEGILDAVDDLLEIVELLANLLALCFAANIAVLMDREFVDVAVQGDTAVDWVIDCAHDAYWVPWHLAEAQCEDCRCRRHLANSIGWLVKFGGNIPNHGRRVLLMMRPPALRFLRVPVLKRVVSMSMAMILVAVALLGC